MKLDAKKTAAATATNSRPRKLSTIFNSAAALFAATLCISAYVPPEATHSQGIPEIPAELIDKVNRYTEFRTAALDSWHPTKREMLIRTRFADTAQVHQVKFPGAARTQLTFFKDSIGSASYQPSAGNYFLFSKDNGGDENYQNYRYDTASGDITLLTDGKSRNTGGKWSHKGDQYAYESNKRNKKDMDIYIMSPIDKKDRKNDRLIAEMDGGGWSVADWSPDDKTLLLHHYVSINESYLWLYDIATGKKTALTEQKKDEPVSYQGGTFSADGKGIYTSCDRGSEFLRLNYIDISSHKHDVLIPDLKWEVSEFSLSWDGKSLAYVLNEDGIAKLHIVDTQTIKEKSVPALPIGQVGELHWHKNNEDLGFNLESARSPIDAYSYNVKTGKLDRWTASETGGLVTTDFSEPELVKWKSFDGKIISGILYMPPKRFTGKRPVIINIHGGPEGQSTAGFLGRLNYYLNELGVAIIFPNVRGSTGYGKTFLKLDNGFLREDTYKDIDELISWIGKSDKLDSGKIMVTGGSYGGHMTLAIACNYSDKIKCAIDVVGPSNLVTFLERTEAYRRDLRRVEYGDERDPKMREFLEKIAPRNKVDKIKVPLFVVQGKNDPRVPVQESTDMVEVIQKKGTPAWYLVADDEGHGFKKKKNSDYQFYSTILFVKKFLLGENT